MRILRCFSAILLCILVLLLVSCAHEKDDLGGVRVTPEMLESVSCSIAEAAKSKSSEITLALTTHTKDDMHTVLSDTEVPESTETDVPDVVYWTENGTVYHFRQDCGTLRHSQHISQGSVEDALLAKKERACKSCS